ncbi:hypothetical protein [Bacillus sp. I-2]|nr:hypothetical protein [Bacillus sp. I-2]
MQNNNHYYTDQVFEDEKDAEYSSFKTINMLLKLVWATPTKR